MTQNNRIIINVLATYGRSIFAIVCCATSVVHAARIPSWLPDDSRFEVTGGSNEVCQVEATLTAMRENINPSIKAYVEKNDLLGPYLQWVVRWCRPGITNDTQYLSRAAHPAEFSLADFDRDRLTNYVSRIRYVPPVVKLSLVWNEKLFYPISRPEPGIDYPGISYEDEGSTDYALRYVLRAPKMNRRIRVLAHAHPRQNKEVEYRWLVLKGTVYVDCFRKKGDVPDETADVNVVFPYVQSQGEQVIAVFAREKGRIWGPPSFVRISVDDLGKHEYVKKEIYSIDYGDFKDLYTIDGEGRILGFDRSPEDSFEKIHFSNFGEVVLETHPGDTPKVTQKVRYFVEGGKLHYRILDKKTNHKFGSMQYRPYNW